MHGQRVWVSGIARAVILICLVLATGCRSAGQSPVTPPTETPEPIVPTRTPSPPPTTPPATATASPTESVATATPAPAMTATTEPTPIPTLTGQQREELNRFGIVGAVGDVEAAAAAGLRFGQFAFWRTMADLPEVADMTWWQTVRLGQVGEWGEWPAVQDQMIAVLTERPGSFWLIGNEPDVRWQDNVTADRYAEQYHDIYRFIKEYDPSAQVAAGGIALPTPLRLRYLDDVLAHYEATYGEPMPVDLWHIHTFTLREELDSWGIGIPPGMDDTAGRLYEIEDHGDIELLKSHVVVFREWMAANGYADTPLAITEFGILLPEDYGFPVEFVGDYLREAVDYFRTATGETGMAGDDRRLVQYWFWYSLYDEGAYPTGNLFDGPQQELTELGVFYRSYLDELLRQR